MSRCGHKLDWWREMLAEQCEQHGISATAEQISALAIDVYDCTQSISEMFPGASAAGTYRGPTEADRLKAELHKERAKVTCRQCNGTGSITQGGLIVSISQCWKCSGQGRHSP